MKFSNKYNLPQPLVSALKRDDYDLKDPPENVISLTTLISAPKIKVLEARHDEEIEQDVSECFWKVLGTACHKVMEESTDCSSLSEFRWYLNTVTWTVNVTSGRPEQEKWFDQNARYVSGKIDIYQTDEKKLSDYKITSVWSWIMEKGMKPEHEAQIQINGFALKILKYAVEKLSVVMMFRDWSRTKNADELPVPFKEIFTTPWADTLIREYIILRLGAHYAARNLKDDEITECFPEERWARPTVYAVMKPGRKSSVKNFDLRPTPAQMAEFPGCTIVERPGEDVRCTWYCQVTKWCSYYRNIYGVRNVSVEETY